MNTYINFIITYICLTLLVTGCHIHNQSNQSSVNSVQLSSSIYNGKLPEKIRTLKNLTAYPVVSVASDTVIFKKVRVFQSTKHVFINGFIGNIAVDNKNRLYISAGKPHTSLNIYVFKPDGEFISKIGQIGKGPGEFLTIRRMKIRNGKLYVYDSSLRRISVFSLVNFKLEDDAVISKAKGKYDSLLAGRVPGYQFYILDKHTYLVNFWIMVANNKHREMLYYRVSRNGKVLPGIVLKRKRFKFYLSNKKLSNDIRIIPFTMPFTRRNLIAVSNKGKIYTANTNQLLIKVYNKKGTYERAFYYPYNNSKLNLSRLEDIQEINRNGRKILQHSEVPKTWPALHTMFFDDQNRLWIFLITDSKTHYKGWVLNKKGKLLARFTWPGKRTENSVLRKPVMLIKNGYLYKRILYKNKHLINGIVKYKIHFKKRK